jgi:hypothetical protein
MKRTNKITTNGNQQSLLLKLNAVISGSSTSKKKVDKNIGRTASYDKSNNSTSCGKSTSLTPNKRDGTGLINAGSSFNLQGTSASRTDRMKNLKSESTNSISRKTGGIKHGVS